MREASADYASGCRREDIAQQRTGRLVLHRRRVLVVRSIDDVMDDVMGCEIDV